MNTNQLKKFAQETRRELLKQVSARLDFVLKGDTPELREKVEQVKGLKKALDEHGKEQLIDKVAYTWFNRLVALRFMDVNDFQPLGIRVITPQDGFTIPELLQEARQAHIPDELKVDSLRIQKLMGGSIPSADPQNEAYRLLFVGACNHLNKVFPFLFESINDWMELLLPDDLISELSVLELVRNGMTAEDCKEVEIIGWLYQFYISEKKDAVFAAKGKVKKEDIPAVTQLFTPRWIVEYMVQNTLGKLWLQNRPNSKLREHMPYFMESPSMESDDFLEVDSVEEIKLLDQACGSGHILVYAFDLFLKIYEEEGYNTSEIAKLIIGKNLHGFEIDERAAQLSSLAILMEARSKSRRLFKKEDVPKPNILQFHDLKLSSDEIKSSLAVIKFDASDAMNHDLSTMTQATNLGSLIQPHSALSELDKLQTALTRQKDSSDVFLRHQIETMLSAVSQLLTLSQKFHCIVDNPPYMGGGAMNKTLSDFVKKNYPDSKADLMACFMEAGLTSLVEKGILGMINQHSWMFLSSYEKLRQKLTENISFDTLLHLGPRTFPEIGGEVVQNAAFTILNRTSGESGAYLRLVDFDKSELKRVKTLEAIQNPDCGWYYSANQKDFETIPGSPLGYWLSSSLRRMFSEQKSLKEIANLKQGMATTNNDQFMRRWYECSASNTHFHLQNPERTFQNIKWVPYSKGGASRKWYGNQEYVVNFKNNGQLICDYIDNTPGVKVKSNGRVINRSSYFKEALTWSLTSSGGFSVRFRPAGSVFDVNGMSLFMDEGEDLMQLLLHLNSKLSFELLKTLNPTLAFQKGDIEKLPIQLDVEYDVEVSELIEISKRDWDSRETSWEFTTNPLVAHQVETIEEAFFNYSNERKDEFFRLHKLEETLNANIISSCGLAKEVSSSIMLGDISILKEESAIIQGSIKINAKTVISQLLSFAVGCTFGRYSTDAHGLVLNGFQEGIEEYLQRIQRKREKVNYLPDSDNIVPVLSDEWFTDDVTGRFYEFIKVVFAEGKFSENFAFVTNCIGKDIRSYFLKDFYNDHIKRYKKRPIYWMFSSEKGAFNVLIYMHRYTPDTLNIILNDYLRPFIDKLKNRVSQLEHIEQTGEGKEKTRALKEMDKLQLQIKECETYERDVLYPLASKRIEIDLDDGVLVNYNKFGKAVKEVKGLNDKKTKDKVRGFDWIDGTEII